jgi:hypothetical protein
MLKFNELSARSTAEDRRRHLMRRAVIRHPGSKCLQNHQLNLDASPS